MGTNKWIAALDELTSAFTNHFGSLTIGELSWKPHENTWSIAQNIDHLMVINQSYFPILDQLAKGNNKPPFFARFNFLVSLMGKIVLNAVEPDRKRKTKTFSIWEPEDSPRADDLLQRFSHHQDELKLRILNNDTSVRDGVVISSPANRNIVYTLDKAFDIIVSHERRHLNQAMEVLALLNMDASALGSSN
jgi:hypothetical protein